MRPKKGWTRLPKMTPELEAHMNHVNLDDPTCKHCREVQLARMTNQMFDAMVPKA